MSFNFVLFVVWIMIDCTMCVSSFFVMCFICCRHMMAKGRAHGGWRHQGGRRAAPSPLGSFVLCSGIQSEGSSDLTILVGGASEGIDATYSSRKACIVSAGQEVPLPGLLHWHDLPAFSTSVVSFLFDLAE